MRRIALVLLLLAAPALADTDKISLANLPTCTAGNPISLWVLDSVDADTCDPEQVGSSDAHCCCANGTWESCAGSGGSGSGDIEDVWSCTSGNCNALTAASGDSLDAGSADASSPTTRSTSLPGTCSEGQVHQDTDSGGSETYVCTASNTWTKLTTAADIVGVGLDLGDDGGGDSAGITELATIYDRYGTVTEPSADKALFDFATLIDHYLSGPPASPGTPDCEFNSSICSYTAVTGSSATIDPYATGTVASYSTALRDGFLAMQAGQASGTVVELRYDYTVADGEAVYAALYPGLHMNGVNNTSQCLLGLNSTDTGHDDGTFFRVQIDKQVTDNYRFLSYDGADIGSWDVGGAPAVWFAIARRTLTYYAWASINGGVNWVYLGGDTVGSAHTNVWLACFAGGAITASHAIPVSLWDWIRTGDDDPYTPGW